MFLYTGSVVVPGFGETMEVVCSVSRFIKVLFPLLVFPKMAMCSRSPLCVSISEPKVPLAALNALHVFSGFFPQIVSFHIL